MIRKIVTISAIVSVALMANDSQGVEIMQLECYSCHTKSVKKIKPSDKASVQWERFFAKNSHQPRIALQADKKEILKTFLISHSADSEYPTVPGL